MAADQKVLLDGKMRQDFSAFEHLDDAAAEELDRIGVGNVLAFKADLSVGDLAMFDREQARDRFQRRRFAGAVAAEQNRDLAGPHFEVDAAQHLNDAVKDDIDVAQFQQHRRNVLHETWTRLTTSADRGREANRCPAWRSCRRAPPAP
jgi:hypothetical protein